MKRSSKILAIISPALIFAGIAFLTVSCNKEPIPEPFTLGHGKVSFNPTLYGEILPWCEQGGTKAAEDFTPVFFEHVVRIYDDGGTPVIDLPIGTDDGSSVLYALPEGHFTAELIPVLETGLGNTPGTYTFADVFDDAGRQSYSKAAVYTRDTVGFDITYMAVTQVPLSVETDFSIVVLDLTDTYGNLTIPAPSVIKSFDGNLLAALETAGPPYDPEYFQLVNSSDNHWRLFTADLHSVAFGADAESESFWWDAGSQCYILYTVPGEQGTTYDAPNGDGSYDLRVRDFADFIAFDVQAKTGPQYPCISLQDYFGTSPWGSNSIIRVRFTGDGAGLFVTVAASPWFGDIIDAGDLP